MSVPQHSEDEGRRAGRPSFVPHNPSGLPAEAVWSSGDICRHLKVSRKTLHVWRQQPDFPEPFEWRGSQGGRWDSVSVVRWHQRRAGRRAGPRGRAVQLRREGRSVRSIARSLGVARSTVRRWLDSAGVGPNPT